MLLLYEQVAEDINGKPPSKLKKGNGKGTKSKLCLMKIFETFESAFFVKALVRWATGKRLNNRLPKLSLIAMSPLLNSGILGLRMGPYVPTPKFFTISGDP